MANLVFFPLMSWIPVTDCPIVGSTVLWPPLPYNCILGGEWEGQYLISVYRWPNHNELLYRWFTYFIYFIGGQNIKTYVTSLEL